MLDGINHFIEYQIHNGMAAIQYETHSTGITVPSSVVPSSANTMRYDKHNEIRQTQSFVHNSNLTVNHYLVQHVSTCVFIAGTTIKITLRKVITALSRSRIQLGVLFYEKKRSN